MRVMWKPGAAGIGKRVLAAFLPDMGTERNGSTRYSDVAKVEAGKA
jgi:hypothetical protein